MLEQTTPDEATEPALLEFERLRLAVRAAGQGVWDWDLRTDRFHLCPRALDLLGYDRRPDRLDPDAWLSRVHPNDVPEMMAILEAQRRPPGSSFRIEHRVDVGGRWRWLVCSGASYHGAEGSTARLVGLLADVTEDRHAGDLPRLLMERPAPPGLPGFGRTWPARPVAPAHYLDGLTGLPNRARLVERLQEAVAACLAGRSPGCALIQIDIDRFQSINDSMGPMVGDELLAAFADTLKRSRAQEGDLVVRLGADEFAVLIEGVSRADAAVAAAYDVATQLMQPLSVAGRAVDLTASLGVAVWDETVLTADELLREAGLALFRAKSGGAGRVQVFERGLRDDAQRRRELEAELRTALGAGELELFYQPVVELETGDLRGYEALVRWRHRKRGLIPPADFIPLAEETGLIVAIGQWTMGEAARQLAQWRARHPERPDLFVSVNLSTRQFADHTLLTDVDAILRSTGVPPSSFKLEITETALLDDPDQAVAMLEGLRSLGVQLWLDDFGTGYSSLGYLYRLPLDGLKIDRSFIMAIRAGDKRLAILRAIVSLAKDLGLDIVAEGVEDMAEIDYLRGLDCRLGQGYHFARPMPADAAESWLTSQ